MRRAPQTRSPHGACSPSECPGAASWGEQEGGGAGRDGAARPNGSSPAKPLPTALYRLAMHAPACCTPRNAGPPPLCPPFHPALTRGPTPRTTQRPLPAPPAGPGCAPARAPGGPEKRCERVDCLCLIHARGAAWLSAHKEWLSQRREHVLVPSATLLTPPPLSSGPLPPA